MEITGLVQVNYVLADEQKSWLEEDTGILAYSENGLNVQQALIKFSDTYSNGLSYNLVANYYQLGEQNFGISQAEVIYKPLSRSEIRWRARGGYFYPKMSLENVDTGWLSPFTYTQSAINSWIGEELRTPGLEFTLYSPGRARKSAFSWELHSAAYQGNDPLGTVISWRGFALHDRQSLNNDKVPFAAYPSVVDEDQVFHPNYVEPSHELDGHVGFYIGAHLDYYNQTSLRYYYYDNQADPLAVSDERLYGWRTKFHSLALQHKLSRDTRLIAQWLSGSTSMGPRVVYVNFDSSYLMLSHKIAQHRLSLRAEYFKVREDDSTPWDPNNSDGKAVTLAWRYNVDKNWQIGLEQHINQNSAENRRSLNQQLEINQQQSLAVVQFRW
ncbi:hypothetical protein [Paraglaciecola sp. L3A3]|uniref:hypothetical protein n=1 Tax=Paraglaciecola sp. L3A3 TaxID=2686358 RepID=UPI001E3BECB5|nr:hypothetical protein [Paraglaciecola sp. L3A3]